MIIITATTDKGMILPLGRQDEKNARQVWFDLTWLIENFGEGTAELKYQRSEDGAPYLVNTTRVSNQLIWTVSRTDVAFDGFGKAEIVWTVTGADTEAKTVIYRTNVLASLATETEVPDPYESWYDQMIEYINEHEVDPDVLDAAIRDYLDKHPIESPVQSVNSKIGDVVLTAQDVGALPSDTAIPTKTSDLTNDSGFLTAETDPTVPSWAKQTSKPSYTAQEVGALPASTTIPTKVSQLQNDSGFGTYTKPVGGIPDSDIASAGTWNSKGTYSKPSAGIPKTDLASDVQASLNRADSALQSYTETDPTVPSWAKQPSKPTYTAQEVGALPASTVIPVVDATLATQGAAADAKKTGDELARKYEKPAGGIPASDLASGIVAASVTVTGSTPSIAAAENTRYICGEVTLLDFTPCVSGICDVVFTSGSAAAVLTIPSTVKFPDWFDPTSLDTNTTYEINVLDGVYGVVMSWT